jgi:uncharacterized protein (TIGR00645 family)
MSAKFSIEHVLERTIFALRWLMAPVYLGLGLTIGLLMVVFLRELAHYLPQAMEMSVETVILVALTLIDLSLVGNLMVIVLMSGYENFVSKFDLDSVSDRPAWLDKIDFSGLKIKLLGSIVAISAIHLLKLFMEIGKEEGASIDAEQIRWLLAIHAVLVVSGLLLAGMDWLKERAVPANHGKHTKGGSSGH